MLCFDHPSRACKNSLDHPYEIQKATNLYVLYFPCSKTLCLSDSMYIHVHLSLHIHIYIYVHICVYTYMHICMYVCIYLSIYVSMYLCTYVSIYLSIYVCIDVYIHIYIYIHTCTYIHIHIHIHTRIHTQLEVPSPASVSFCLPLSLSFSLYPPSLFLTFSPWGVAHLQIRKFAGASQKSGHSGSSYHFAAS